MANGVTHVSVHTRFFPATWLGLSVARDIGLPTVLTEHGGGPVETGSPPSGSPLERWTHPRGGGHSGRLIAFSAVSSRSADFVAHLSGRPATVVGNGIDVDWWQGGDRAADRARLVFVGRLVPEKGWAEFLEVLSACPPQFDGVIAGSGPG